jgi:hypothetical protein
MVSLPLLSFLLNTFGINTISSSTNKRCAVTTAAIRRGFTPIGDILLEINDPEVIKATIITPAIETIKNLKIN